MKFIKIRPLQLTDIGQLGRILRQFADEMGRDMYPTMDAEDIEAQLIFTVETINNPMCLYLVAFDGKKMIGWFFGEYVIRHFGKPRVIGCARELYVVPNKRGKGVATRLIKTAVESALKMGVGGIEQIGVPGKTQPRWEKLGFTSYITHGFISIEKAAELIKEKPREGQHKDRYRPKDRPSNRPDQPQV